MEALVVAAQGFGLVGDIVTLTGAVVLARDLTSREKILKQEENLRAIARLALERGIVIVDPTGVRIEKMEDVVDATITAVTHLGRRGVTFLLTGCTFLIVYRALEIVAALR